MFYSLRFDKSFGGKMRTVRINENLEIIIYRTEEICAIAMMSNPEAHDLLQANYHLDYTKELVDSREPTTNELKRTISNNLGTFFHGKGVLEIGPGIEDILYQVIISQDRPAHWQSLDINQVIVDRLNERYSGHIYYLARQGTSRHLPFDDASMDVVCGMCALDSIIDFDNVANEISRVLKPGGNLIHIQDLLPSWMTIISLAARDPACLAAKEVWLHCLTTDGVQSIGSIQVPNIQPFPSLSYLHSRLSEEFKRYGLARKDHGFRPYASHNGSATNMKLYSYLIMQK